MARQMTDIMLNDSEDAVILAGDFVATESTAQHQLQLILNNKGDFKQNPTICVGIPEHVDDEGLQNVVRSVSIEFARDGMEVLSIRVNGDGVITSDAYYV